ncbi:MAG: thermonuclease family protein [Beijerinckiaceae bacterium]|nr:thermonuclease family protein [Beijerinckiaceae bacterium]
MVPFAVLADPCRPARLEAANDVVANERLEIELADGRVIRLAGVESPLVRGADPAAMQSAADDLALWTSTLISVFILKDQPDRWGRMEGRAFIAEKGFAPDLLPSLSEAIIDAGLARVDPLTETRPCLDRLYVAEQRARSARRGLWTDPAFAVLDASRPQEFKGISGAVAVVEGRVASVRAGRGVTFVNLGEGGPQSPALILGREALRMMQRDGRTPQSLNGRMIRARGVLDRRAGLRIEVTGPGAIELLPDAPAGR